MKTPASTRGSYDDTDPDPSSSPADILSQNEGMQNRHTFREADSSGDTNDIDSTSSLNTLSESIRSTHEKLCNSASANARSQGPLAAPASASSQPLLLSQPERRPPPLAPSAFSSVRPTIPNPAAYDGDVDEESPANDRQNESPRPPGGPVMTREWHLPPRPKPGRKPATDVPSSKRREQNRVAQRNYRERGKKALEQYENDVKKLEDAHRQERDQLRTLLNQQMARTNHLAAQCDRWKPMAADLGERCHALQAQVSMLQRRLAESTLEKEKLRREVEYSKRPGNAAWGSFSASQSSWLPEPSPYRNYSNSATPIGRCVNCNDLAQKCACIDDEQKRQFEELDRHSLSRRTSQMGGSAIGPFPLPSPPFIDDGRFPSMQRTGSSHDRETPNSREMSEQLRDDTSSTSNRRRDRTGLSRLDTTGTDRSEMEIDMTHMGQASQKKDPELPSAAMQEKGVDCGFCTDRFRGPGGIDCLCNGPVPTQQATVMDYVSLKRKSSTEPPSDTVPLPKRFSAPVHDIERPSYITRPGTCSQCQADPESKRFCEEAAARSQRVQVEDSASGSDMERVKSCDAVYKEISQHQNFKAGMERPAAWLSELKTAPSTDTSHAQAMHAASVLCCMRVLDGIHSTK